MKLTGKRFITILLLQLTVGYLSAQNNIIKLEVSENECSHEVRQIICNQEGLCLYYPVYNKENTDIHIRHYNTELKLVGQDHITIGPKYLFGGITYTNGYVQILFYMKNPRKKDPDPAGLLLVFSLKDHHFERIGIPNLTLSIFNNLRSYENSLYFCSPIDKNNDNLFFLHKNGEETILLQELSISDRIDYNIEDYLIDTIARKLIVCLNRSDNSSNSELWLCETTLEGKATHLVSFPDTGSYLFQSTTLSRISYEKYMVGGTYVHRKNALNKSSEGAYLSIYENGNFTSTNQYAFGDVNSSLSVKDVQAYKGVIYRPGKIVHDSTRYLFSTESFYPVYSYDYTSAYAPTRVFNGYQALQVNIFLLDSNAQLIEKQVIPISQTIISNPPFARMRISLRDNQILFYYTIGQMLYTMLTDNSLNIIEPLTGENMLETYLQSDSSFPSVGLNHWYDNTFLFTYEMLSKSSMNTGKNRTFHYIPMTYQ